MNDSTWTWISGSDSTNQPGVYDEQGSPNTSNVPSSRSFASGWCDDLRQEFWVFGGNVMFNVYGTCVYYH